MIEITNEDIKEIVEDITLNIFNIGADRTNFKILKMLPTDLKSVMKELNLTKMPINTRFNELEQAGLIKRRKGTGKVTSTKMTNYFLELINTIKTKVEEEIKPQISNLN
ncbi:MAG: hypothetical protein O8C63_04510 [Candidatus Methanoperedens sp.]|nr:hypothetical protein [Candidatus Methanoperedens sp.]